MHAKPDAALRRVVAHVRTPLHGSGYALLLSTGTTSALGFLYWVIATRLYGVAAVGVNSAIISAMIFLAGISQFEAPSALVRFLPTAGSRASKFILIAYASSAIGGGAAGYIFLAGLPLWSPKLKVLVSSALMAVWFVLSVVFWSINSLQDNALTGLRQAVWVPIENLFSAVFKIVLLVVFATSLPRIGIFMAWTVPALTFILPVNLLIFRILVPRYNRSIPGEGERLRPGQITHFALSNYVGSLFTLASTALLPLVVAREAGVRATAYFYLPWTSYSALMVGVMSFSIPLVVEGAIAPAELAANARRVLIHMMRLLLPAAIVLAIGAPYILRLFGNQYVGQGTLLLRLLAVASIPGSITLIYVSIFRVRRQNYTLLCVLGTQAVLTLGLSLVLLPSHGISGVGVAVLSAQTAVAGALTLAQRIPNLTINFGNQSA